MLQRQPIIVGLVLPLALACIFTGEGDAQDRDASGQPSGALLVETRCGFCHSTPLLKVLAERKLDEDGPEEMKAFLAGHHAPDTEARLAIFQFLLNASELMN